MGWLMTSYDSMTGDMIVRPMTSYDRMIDDMIGWLMISYDGMTFDLWLGKDLEESGN
jgi:hypothetical protein